MSRPETTPRVFAPNVLSGKTAYVAGGTSGINLGIAELLALHGAKVTVIGRDSQKAERAAAGIVAKGGTAYGAGADVRDFDTVRDSLRRVAERDGTIDIVVSGAAGNFLAPAEKMSANAFRTVVEIDLLGTFNVYRAAFDALTRPGASLISITAAQANVPVAMQAHACAAKAGVNMLTRCLALEWGVYGIRVNGLSPGPIEGTEGFRRLIPTPELRAQVVHRIPLQRFGLPEDVAHAALFLCSDAARYVSGTILSCDGASEQGDATQMRMIMESSKPAEERAC